MVNTSIVIMRLANSFRNSVQLNTQPVMVKIKKLPLLDIREFGTLHNTFEMMSGVMITLVWTRFRFLYYL